jgi:hypothetical protein
MTHPLGLSNERIEEMREEIKHQDEYACLIFVSKVCIYCRVHGLEAGKILGELHDADPRKKAENLRGWLESREWFESHKKIIETIE